MAPVSSNSRLLPLYLFLAFSMSSFLFSLQLVFRENSCPFLNGCGTNPGRCLSIPDNFIPANRRLCSDLDNSTNAVESSNQFDKEWEDETSQISLDLKYQHGRKKLIQDLCGNNMTLGYLKKATFSDIPNNQLTNLVVDDRNGILYCYVPKVACTEWKRVMIFLSQSLKDNGVPYRSHSEVSIELTHENVNQLNRNKKEVIQCKIKKYKKFLFVRNPFVRLISAYRDKFEKVIEVFYRYYAVPIMKKYGKKPIDLPDNAEKAYKAGIRPSFSQFIQYLLDLDASEYQEHWKPVYHLCHPCQIQYDFVGKMETLHEDAQHLLQLFKADRIVHFPPTSGHQVEASWVNVWYSKIPSEWKIYKIYEADFKLFGYYVPENFLNASQMEWN